MWDYFVPIGRLFATRDYSTSYSIAANCCSTSYYFAVYFLLDPTVD